MDSPSYEDSPVYDRNPSPPPELLEHEDLLSAERIGDTAFSKHWLFTTLMKLIEEVDKENKEEEEEEGEGRELVVDIDEELQNELCKLWDMSMNSEVATFLNEFKAVEILTGIISKTKAPRVTEICVGILGNMACEPTVCKDMSENQKFIDLILFLLESRDAPTLVECMRLMSTSVSNTGTQGQWVKAIHRSEEFLEHVTFIFSSSTNCDLLKNTAELMDKLLDLESDLCVSWATENFIGSLLEATEQIGSNHSAALEVYLNIFQSFSTTEPGVEALVSHSDRLGKKVLKYLNIVCEYEIVGLGGKEGPLASALSVLNILMNTQPKEFMYSLCKDEQLIRILLKIMEPLYPILNKTKLTGLEQHTENDDSESTDKNTENDLDSEKHVETETNIPDAMGDKKEQQKDITDDAKGDKNQQRDISDDAKGDKNKNNQQRDITDDAKGDTNEQQRDITDDNADNKRDQVTEFSEDMDNDCSLEEGELEALTALHDVLSQFLLEYCKLVVEVPQLDETLKDNSEDDKKSEEEKETETDDIDESAENDAASDKGDNSPNLCLSILTYLDDSCSRSRINYLGLTLKETGAGSELFDILMELGRDREKERLVRILNDVNNFRIVIRANSSKVPDEND